VGERGGGERGSRVRSRSRSRERERERGGREGVASGGGSSSRAPGVIPRACAYFLTPAGTGKRPWFSFRTVTYHYKGVKCVVALLVNERDRIDVGYDAVHFSPVVTALKIGIRALLKQGLIMNSFFLPLDRASVHHPMNVIIVFEHRNKV